MLGGKPCNVEQNHWTKYFFKKKEKTETDELGEVDRAAAKEFKIYSPALQTRPSNVTGRSSEAFISPTYH